MQNNILPKKTFAFGTQYYRMVPPEQDWEKDIANIKSMGMDTIRYWALWKWIEQKPEEYYFDDLHKLMKIAKVNGLDVIIVVLMDAPPLWVYETLPDAGLVPLSNSGIEGVTEADDYLCWDNPAVRKFGERFLSEVAHQLKQYDNLMVMDVWNEPDKPECRCRYCMDKFINWLKDKFATIEELNKAVYHPRFESWRDVKMPRTPWDTTLYILYEEFRTWSLAEQMSWAVQISKREAPDIPATVHCHCDEHPFTFRWAGNHSEVGWDDWEMNKQLDFYITAVHDFYQGVGAYTELQNIGCVIGNLEAKRTITGGQYWTTGLAGGTTKQFIYGGQLTGCFPKDNIFSLWMCVAHEAKGVVYWQYRVETLYGPEAPAWGLTSFNGGETFRTKECKQFIDALRPHEDSMMKSKIKKPDCAILYSLKSHIINETQPQLDYISSYEGICFTLWINNINFDVLNEEQDFSNYKTIYIPMGQCLEHQTGKRLIEFVKNGGKLVMEAATAAFAENGMVNTVIPGAGLAEIAGVQEEDVLFYNINTIETEHGRLQGVTERRIISVNKAEVIGTYDDGMPAITKSKFGNGEVIYITTNVSSAIRKHGGVEYTKVLVDLMDIQPEIAVSPLNTINVRILENEQDKFIFIFNNMNKQEDREVAEITLPFSCTNAELVYKNDSEWSVAEMKIKVTMGYREVLVLKVSV
jgi:beta-galactosidase